MRQKRSKYSFSCFFHIITRAVGKEFLFGPTDKDEMRRLLAMVSQFCGITLLTYALMSNHVHILAKISGKCTADEKELLRRCSFLYDKEKVQQMAKRWKRLRETEQLKKLNSELRSLRKRMDDISMFMKLLKQLWTINFNTMHNRKGTIWEGRFKSLIVEPGKLPIVAAYIDLNAVRARIVSSPQEYPWCGYSEAMGKSHLPTNGLNFARGLTEIYQLDPRSIIQGEMLQEHAERFFRPEFSLEDLPQECWDEQGEFIGDDLPIALYLRCKIGYFTRGFAIGGINFVEQIFQDFRPAFGPKRKTGARKMRGCKELNGLCCARDLRREVICHPKLT